MFLSIVKWRGELSAFGILTPAALKSEAIDFRAASELFAPSRKLTAQAWRTLPWGAR